MHIVAEYREDTKEIFRVSVWTEIQYGAKNYLDITDREGSSGNVSNLLGKFVINGQITDAVTQAAPVVEPAVVETAPEALSSEEQVSE